MALRLVRKTSETPNITNKDDVVMTRYAYGGYNGVVKGFGRECEYLDENGFFKVLDGRIVIDGWEIDVGAEGQSIDLSIYSGTNYFSVFAEINVANESVKLDSIYSAIDYPEIDKGEDLTQVLYGTARILLYNVKVENGRITEVVKKFEIIPYLTNRVLELEKKLEELGFREGFAEYESSFIATTNSLTKQAKYCIFNFEVDRLEFEQNENYEQQLKLRIPEPFCPNGSVDILSDYGESLCTLTIKEDGMVIVKGVYFGNENYYLRILNAGWEIK